MIAAVAKTPKTTWYAWEGFYQAQRQRWGNPHADLFLLFVFVSFQYVSFVAFSAVFIWKNGETFLTLQEETNATLT